MGIIRAQGAKDEAKDKAKARDKSPSKSSDKAKAPKDWPYKDLKGLIRPLRAL